jgi:hypothetical protein
MADEPQSGRSDFKAHKMPERSTFFDRVVPILFVVLGVVMLLLIVFALGVLSGAIQWF